MLRIEALRRCPLEVRSRELVALETGKAWLPKLERRQRGATNWRREIERRLERAVIADVWMKVRLYCDDVPCIERYTSTVTLKRMRSGTCSWPVKADQDVGDVGSPTKSEDHTSSSILEGLRARNDDI
jgi:hypothetical protein